MNPTKTISLVIPSYNRATLIVETINSALNQTLPFAEIIIVDDASTDDTLKTLAQFGDRITVIASKKIGVQAARNIGVGVAKGEYICLCDSDDLLQPEYVAVMDGWLSAHPEYDSLYCNYRGFSADKIEKDIVAQAPASFFAGATTEESFIHSIPDVYARTAYFQPFLASGVTIRKAFYQAIGGFNPGFNGVPSEDWEYTLRALAAGKTAICAMPLVHIRHHASNESKNKLRQAMGEVEVLKFALTRHETAAQYRDLLVAAIHKRRETVFYEAFRDRNLEVAGAVLPLLEDKPRTIPFRIKRAILAVHRLFHRYDLRHSLNMALPSESTAAPAPVEAARSALPK